MNNKALLCKLQHLKYSRHNAEANKTHEHMSKILAALLKVHVRLCLLVFDAYSPMNRLVKNLTKTAEDKREEMID